MASAFCLFLLTLLCPVEWLAVTLGGKNLQLSVWIEQKKNLSEVKPLTVDFPQMPSWEQLHITVFLKRKWMYQSTVLCMKRTVPHTKGFLEFVPNHLPSYTQEGNLSVYVPSGSQIPHTCERCGGTRELPGAFMFSPNICCSKIHFLLRIRPRAYNLLKMPIFQSYCSLKLQPSSTT